MPDASRNGMRVPRETRLLLVTITVSALVLLLLARLRFPEAPPIAETAATPLERLVARATYDELATSVSRVENTIAPSLLVLRLERRMDTSPRGLSDLLSPPNGPPDSVRHVPALRISSTTALAAIGPETRITGIVGATDPTATAGVIAADPIRRMALVRVPEGSPRVLTHLMLSQLRTPLYVVAAEGTHAGRTLRPVFLGSGERFGHPRWGRALLPLGGAPVAPGALIFSLEGQFIGCVVQEDGTLAIAGAQDVTDTIGRLAAGSGTEPADAGIVVQPLTAALAAATGASGGVIVADVREDGPAAEVLEVGDVITQYGGEGVESADLLVLRIAAGRPGATVPLRVWREGKAVDLSLTLGTGRARVPADGGLQLRAVRGTGSVVTSVTPGTAAAGLAAGDVIVRAGSVRAPTPAQIRQLLTTAAPGSHVLLAIRRDGRQRLLAIPAPTRPEAADAAR